MKSELLNIVEKGIREAEWKKNRSHLLFALALQLLFIIPGSYYYFFISTNEMQKQFLEIFASVPTIMIVMVYSPSILSFINNMMYTYPHAKKVLSERVTEIMWVYQGMDQHRNYSIHVVTKDLRTYSFPTMSAYSQIIMAKLLELNPQIDVGFSYEKKEKYFYSKK